MTRAGIRILPKRDDATVAPGMLAHLDQLDGFVIADPAPDVRGWKVVLPDGREVGTVDDLVVDTTELCARYLEVKIDRDVILADRDRWVLVPIAAARIDSARDVVTIERFPATGLADAARPQRDVPTPADERAACAYFEVEVSEAAGRPPEP